MNNNPKVFFTSDTHFGHSFVSKLRFGHLAHPVEANDNTIIDRWNATVGPKDVVYHLGDFAWYDVANYRRRLNGQIHLILGNHDRLRGDEKKLFESVSDQKTFKAEGVEIFLFHYACRVWNKSHYGRWHLYGHSHGSLPDDPNSRSLDIGMDCWDFRPVSIDQIREKMDKKTFKPVDHHGKH